MRTCVFLTVRSGSTFMRHMLMDGKKTVEGAPNPNILHTTPVATHYNEDYPKGHLVNDYLLKVAQVDGPEVYSFYIGLEAGPAFLNSLPGPKDDWRFVYILRDPRGKIESTIEWSRTRDLNPNRPSKEDIFVQECKYGKIRAASVLSMLGDSRFLVFPFEDIVKDPLNAFGKILEFGELKIDRKYYKKLVREWSLKSNSSFGDGGSGAINRWSHWTEDQKSYFKSVMGQELIDLGYETNQDW